MEAPQAIELSKRMCLCGSASPLVRCGHRLTCSCGSFWDVERDLGAYAYDDTYPELRNHFDPRVGRLKVLTMLRWLDACGLKLENLSVCEVGFGGGYCLAEINLRSKHAVGIETTSASIKHAEKLGIPTSRLFSFDALPYHLSEEVDLWIFQDSFEHLPDPASFIDWALRNSALNAMVIIVCPLAGSWSERLMGRWWPHRVPDHPFHWSSSGISRFFRERGLVVVRRFYPWKLISLDTIVRHLMVLDAIPTRTSIAGRMSAATQGLSFPFNFGEMGLLLRRAP